MSSTAAGEINVSMNDTSKTDEEYVNNLQRKKSDAKSRKQQNQRQNQQLEQQQEEKTHSDNYYFSSLLPAIPYERIEEVLRPNTGRTPIEKIRDKQLCPICYNFQHFNRYVLRQHIESHIEFAEVRRFSLTSEREYKKLLKQRFQLREIELPRLQTEINQLDSQIRRFENSEDTKETAKKLRDEILQRRKQGLADYDNDPYLQSPVHYSLLEGEEKGEEGQQEGGEDQK